MSDFKPKEECPKLAALAEACCNGACNPGGLIRSFPAAIDELPVGSVAAHPAVKVILGQLSYLCGESVGPTTQAFEEYRLWADGCNRMEVTYVLET